MEQIVVETTDRVHRVFQNQSSITISLNFNSKGRKNTEYFLGSFRSDMLIVSINYGKELTVKFGIIYHLWLLGRKDVQ